MRLLKWVNDIQDHVGTAYDIQNLSTPAFTIGRTLDESRNRTLLGCNLSCEFFAGRFGTDGEAVRSMEVFDEHDAG